MSSFRADRDWEDRAFVPSVRLDVESKFLHDRQMVGAVSARGLGDPDGLAGASDDGSARGVETWTPERIEALETAAFERGVASAEQANADMERVCALLEASALELDRAASTSIAANRELLLSLAMEIAEKWLGAELRLDPARFGDVLDGVVADWPSSDGACLYVHPSDRAVLLSSHEERVAGWAEHHSICVEEDAGLEPGTFRIEGARGHIDGSNLAIQERLRLALSEALVEDDGEASQ